MLTKALFSFFSLFIGWCAAITTLVCWQVFVTDYGYVTDFNFFMFWPALFAVCGWLIFVVPAINIVRREQPVMQFPAIIVTGAVYGVLIYLILVCTWATGTWRLAWFPAVMGGVGGGVYSLLMRSPLTDHLRGYRAMTLFLAPAVILCTFSFVIWPLVTRHLPYVAYVFGAGESRAAAHLQIFKHIRKGDTFTDLHRRYPRIFKQPIRSMLIEDSGFHFSISFDKTGTYVDKVEFREKQ